MMAKIFESLALLALWLRVNVLFAARRLSVALKPNWFDRLNTDGCGSSRAGD